jgi:hypothetical protein
VFLIHTHTQPHETHTAGSGVVLVGRGADGRAPACSRPSSLFSLSLFLSLSLFSLTLISLSRAARRPSPSRRYLPSTTTTLSLSLLFLSPLCVCVSLSLSRALGRAFPLSLSLSFFLPSFSSVNVQDTSYPSLPPSLSLFVHRCLLSPSPVCVLHLLSPRSFTHLKYAHVCSRMLT